MALNEQVAAGGNPAAMNPTPFTVNLPGAGSLFIDSSGGPQPGLYNINGGKLQQFNIGDYATNYLKENGIDAGALQAATAAQLGIGPYAGSTSNPAYNPTLAAMYKKAYDLGVNPANTANNWSDAGGFATINPYNLGVSLLKKNYGVDLSTLSRNNIGDVISAIGPASQTFDASFFSAPQGAATTKTLNDTGPITLDQNAIDASTATQKQQLAGVQGQNVQTTLDAEGNIIGSTKTPVAAPGRPGAQTTPVGYQTPEQVAAAAQAAGQNPSQSQPNDITQLLTLPDLAPGAKGQEVLTLQNWLVAHGFLTASDLATGPGTYGPKTTAAVAAWQAASGIDTAGNPGYFGSHSKAYLQQQIQSGAQTAQPGTTGTQGTTGNPGGGTGTGGTGTQGDGADMSGVSDLTDLSNQIRKLYGLPESNSGTTITEQAIKDYQAIYTALGIPDIKQSYQDAVKEFSDLQDKLNSDIADINEDPWLSEGVRQARISRAQSRYETKLDTATNKMNLYKSLTDQGTAQARDILGQIHNAQTATDTAVNQAIDIVTKQIDAQTALAKTEAKGKDTQVVEAGGRKLLVDTQTGQTIKDLGSATTGTSNPKGTVTSGGLTYTPQAQTADSQKLEASRGPDGWTDPNVFLSLYNAWIQKGGNTGDFIKTYPPKLYVNPANDWLPPILRTSKDALDSQIDSLY